MSKRDKWPEAAREKERKTKRERLARQRREAKPGLPPYVPGVNPVRISRALWPTIDLAPGQELRAQTIHSNPDGTLRSRYDKTAIEHLPPKFETVPEGHHVTKTTTRIDADGRVGMQYVTAAHKAADREREFWEACERNAKQYEGIGGVAAPLATACRDDLISLYPMGDPHIGMLAHALETGAHFDTAIACRELLACQRELVGRAPPSRRAIIVNLGDAAHAQDDFARTPGHSNQLDVDGRWFKVLDAIHTTFRGIIDFALTKHEHVTFRNLPGNHDPRVAVELMYWLRAVYASDPRVTVADAYAAHQYDHFGVNLFGWHHGDRTKKGELPAIMAHDHDGGHTGLWGQTSEHVWYVGHEHHTTTLETPACFVRVMNTLAGRDAYHAGRYRAKQVLEVHSYHRDFGLDSAATVSLTRVQAALRAMGEVAP